MNQIQYNIEEFNKRYLKSFDYQYYNSSYNSLKKTGKLYQMLNFCNNSFYTQQKVSILQLKEKENEEAKSQLEMRRNEILMQKKQKKQIQKQKKKTGSIGINDSQRTQQDQNQQIAQQKVAAILKSHNLSIENIEEQKEQQSDPVVQYNQRNPFDVSNFIKSEMQKEYMQIIKQNPAYQQGYY